MASIYDSINSPKELLEIVKFHGLSTEIEDICRAQDIFGRATLQELVTLANDNGRMNDSGETDPNGIWSSGRDGLQKTFYSVLFHIWNWEEATRFWNQHTNPEYAKLKKQAEAARKTNEALELANHNCEVLQSNERRLHDELSEAANEIDMLQEEVATQAEEILKLKAKLYDLMVSGK